MKLKPIGSCCVVLLASMLWTATPARAAESAALQTEARQTDMLTARHGTQTVQARMTGEFSAFAGSEANAQSLVTGLRNGTPITLTSSSAAGGTTATALTFDPLTRPMGHGNVFISLALARQQLANYGITDPAPQHIQAALTGGTLATGSGATAQTVTLQGILTQRADGMGWGAIARSQGMNLGRVVSGLKSANQQIIAAGAAGRTGGSVAAGSGAPAQTQTTGAVSGIDRSPNAHALGAFRGGTSGIVTAGGNAAGAGVNADAQAGVRAGSAGIVTGTGAAAAVRGNVNAQGQGKGLLKH
ncbi:MAG: hypothetical protein HY526_04865 [Betaproteobacteria bacterium]|nr:hypothetical protein [Betaproteobacteria bacterium]